MHNEQVPSHLAWLEASSFDKARNLLINEYQPEVSQRRCGGPPPVHTLHTVIDVEDFEAILEHGSANSTKVTRSNRIQKLADHLANAEKQEPQGTIEPHVCNSHLWNSIVLLEYHLVVLCRICYAITWSRPSFLYSFSFQIDISLLISRDKQRIPSLNQWYFTGCKHAAPVIATVEQGDEMIWVKDHRTSSSNSSQSMAV
ncbi:hypothetical protein Pfo_013872 [Paulownia fortunei]|nr:hypothetical protein Pfo_013872 [Paulownia fortunei]